MQKSGLEGNTNQAKNWKKVSSIEFICTAVRNFSNHHTSLSSNHKPHEMTVNDKMETVGDVAMNMETNMEQIKEAFKMHEIHDSPDRYGTIRIYAIFFM